MDAGLFPFWEMRLEWLQKDDVCEESLSSKSEASSQLSCKNSLSEHSRLSEYRNWSLNQMAFYVANLPEHILLSAKLSSLAKPEDMVPEMNRARQICPSVGYAQV